LTEITRIEVLCVEDSRSARLLLRNILAASADPLFVMRDAESLAQAETVGADWAPEVVLLDLGLPDSSGIATLLATRHLFPEAAIVVCTGNGEHSVGLEVLQQGAEDFLVKGEYTAPMLIRSVRLATERKRMKRHLREKEAIITAISSAAQDAIIMLDHNGAIVFWNTAAENMFGWTGEDARGKNLHTLLAPLRYREAFQNAFARFQQTGGGAAVGKILELAGIGKNGREFPIEISLSAVCLQGKWNAVGIVRDISARKAVEAEREALQRELVQAQKLETIGMIAAGIAHEINTPTQFIGDNLQFLQEAFETVLRLVRIYEQMIDETRLSAAARAELAQKVQEWNVDFLLQEVPQALLQAYEGTQRIAHIVRAMREFSHPDSPEKNNADLNHALRNTVIIAQNEWKLAADVELDLDPGLPFVPCHLGSLNQVFLNLLVNAAQAVAGQAQKTKQKGLIRIESRRSEGTLADWVELRFHDSGEGIPPEHHHKIFQPFFTTKAPGKGTGQGLAISYQVITKKHAGKIWFTSETGQGTTFFIRLPLL
jgi:PAS domain S-box-containing protein